MARDRQRHEMNRGLVSAWQSAALSRQKKLPGLMSLLDRGPKKVQSYDEMRSAMEQVAQQWGLKARVLKRDVASRTN